MPNFFTMLPSFLHRRTHFDDPFAPRRVDWAGRVIMAVIFVVAVVFWIGGFFMFLGSSIVRFTIFETEPASNGSVNACEGHIC
ncbi:hypothetical protein DL93DRAFT_2069608 [Clavulina sp. PMI_390]|nr:hypothetical protein DL93DRAFT_2069608 [Clavulina sp. PMI_390]